MTRVFVILRHEGTIVHHIKYETRTTLMKQFLFGFLLFVFAFSQAQSVPDFASVKDAHELNWERMNLDSLPHYITQCTQLKKINLSGNRKIKVNDTFQKLSKLPKLEILIIDYCNLFFLPSVISDFKALKILSVEGNGISWLPPSFKNLPIEELNLSKNNIDSLNIGFYSLLKLKELNFSQNKGVVRDYNMEILASFPLLKSLILQDSKELPKGIGKLKLLEKLDISGGIFKQVPSEISQLTKLKILKMQGCAQVDLSVIIEFLAATKTLIELYCGYPKMSVIPFNISKLRNLKKLYLYDCSLSRLPISFKELALSDIYFFRCSFPQETEFFKELGNGKPEKYLHFQNCEIQPSYSKTFIFAKDTIEQSFQYDNQFNKVALDHQLEIPQMSYQLLTSKVYLKVKKQVSKNKFSFTLEPQYGYTEKYLDVFGDKVKAYPELKVYKGIKWDYTGNEMDIDLLKMYALSEKNDADKAKKKVTFDIYVLNLQDIFIYPEKEEDTYVMAYSRGFDTLRIKVLPSLSLIDAKKIQKWHKSKYESYLNERAKRQEKWVVLDKKYLLAYEKHEDELEKFRTKLNAHFYNEFKK